MLRQVRIHSINEEDFRAKEAVTTLRRRLEKSSNNSGAAKKVTVPDSSRTLQGDISLVMLLQTDAPGRHGNCLHSLPHFAIEADLATILVASEDVHPRIGWVLEYTQHAAVAEPAPYNLAIPRPAVSSLGKS